MIKSKIMNGLVCEPHSVLRPLQALNLIERRVFGFVIQHYNSQVGASNPKIIEVAIDDFKKTFPEYHKCRPGLIYKICENACDGIQGKGYKPIPGKSRKIYWFDSLELLEDEGDGVKIQFELTRSGSELFLNLSKHFISYHINDVILVGKASAWNLFEYLKEMYLNGKNSEWIITVEELRARLLLNAKYKFFRDFEQQCLKKPTVEINEKTNLNVEYTKIKKGVRIHKIRFRVIEKHSAPKVIDVEDMSKTLERELLKAGINKIIIKKHIIQAKKDGKISELLKTIDKAKLSWKKHGKGTLAAYLSGVIQNTLHEKDLPLPFKTSAAEKKKAKSDFAKMSLSSVKQLAECGNIFAKNELEKRQAE